MFKDIIVKQLLTEKECEEMAIKNYGNILSIEYFYSEKYDIPPITKIRIVCDQTFLYKNCQKGNCRGHGAKMTN